MNRVDLTKQSCEIVVDLSGAKVNPTSKLRDEIKNLKTSLGILEKRLERETVRAIKASPEGKDVRTGALILGIAHLRRPRSVPTIGTMIPVIATIASSVTCRASGHEGQHDSSHRS